MISAHRNQPSDTLMNFEKTANHIDSIGDELKQMKVKIATQKRQDKSQMKAKKQTASIFCFFHMENGGKPYDMEQEFFILANTI